MCPVRSDLSARLARIAGADPVGDAGRRRCLLSTSGSGQIALDLCLAPDPEATYRYEPPWEPPE